MAKRRVLLIEDEDSISEPLAAALQREGFAPSVAGTMAEGLESFRTHPPDLVLLDVMLPDGDGRDVLRQLRSTSRTPVIMLTARGEEMDRVIGLELGADDYVSKPFSAAELVARIRAVLRRTAAPAPTERGRPCGEGRPGCGPPAPRPRTAWTRSRRRPAPGRSPGPSPRRGRSA